MDYQEVQASLQAYLSQHLKVSEAQCQRISRFGLGVLLAGSTSLSEIAKFQPDRIQQDSRIRRNKRLLDALFLTFDYVYRPFITAILASYRAREWYLAIDRTSILGGELDLVTVNLIYHKRSLPLVWESIPYGLSGQELHIQLLDRLASLIPDTTSVVLIGDNEFASTAIMKHLCWLGWDFILGLACDTYIRREKTEPFVKLQNLKVTKKQPLYLEAVEVTKQDVLSGLNVYAIYQPIHNYGKRKKEIAYFATTLPPQKARRVGRQRWGIESFYKDCKSGGWHLTDSQITQPARLARLFLLLALVYVWCMMVGRWLSKSGQRRLVDSRPKRHLSLFRIGWTWLVHQFCARRFVPVILILYQ